MKRMLTIGALALVAAALLQERASAWCNFNFGVGANVSWQCGGNKLLWGAYQNGQPPAGFFQGTAHGHHQPGFGPAGVYPYGQFHGMTEPIAAPAAAYFAPMPAGDFSGMAYYPQMPQQAPAAEPSGRERLQAFRQRLNANAESYGAYDPSAYYYPVNWYGR